MVWIVESCNGDFGRMGLLTMAKVGLDCSRMKLNRRCVDFAVDKCDFEVVINWDESMFNVDERRLDNGCVGVDINKKMVE